jgi:hypothetical protein
LEAHPSPAVAPFNVFAEFWQAVSGHTLATRQTFDLPYLVPQILPGHRVWCEASDERERFISLEEVLIKRDKTTKELWLVLHVHAGTLSQNEVTHAELLRGSGLFGQFKHVQGFSDAAANEPMVVFEQRVGTPYSHRPSDAIPRLIESFRHVLWTTVLPTRPFRWYYLYVAPAAERPQVLPQLVSAYAVTYYLGSITRYRPQQFDALLRGDFGVFIQEFLTTQPGQFLYLMASEFAKRQITRPGLA